MFVLKQLRRKKRISQTDLALVVGVSLRTIQLYEKKNANIPIKNLTKIAAYFEVSIAELYSNEVNEQEGTYQISKINSKEGRSKTQLLGSNKNIISVPLVSTVMQQEYIENQENLNFLDELAQVNFVIECIQVEGHYEAFEIVGNSMVDGSIHSIPDQTVVLVKEIVIENLNERSNLKDKVVVILFNDSLLCKKIVDYDEKRKIITFHSLNVSPEYADFEVPLVEIRRIFEVVSKQITLNKG